MSVPTKPGLLDISTPVSSQNAPTASASASTNSQGDTTQKSQASSQSSRLQLPPAAQHGGIDDFFSDMDSGEDGPPDYDDVMGYSGGGGDLPPAYGEDGRLVPSGATAAAGGLSSSSAAAAAVMVEPRSLILSGQTVLLEGAAGTSSYSLDRGIGSLSHSDTNVTLERLDHVNRRQALPVSEKGSAAGQKDNTRTRHIYDLRHVDDHRVSLMTKGHNWTMTPHDSLDMIPRFFGLAATRRCWGSFGLRQVSSDRYAVTPLAGGSRRKVEDGDLPRFAPGEKKEGKEFARSVFEARVVTSTSSRVGGHDGNGGSSSGSGSSRLKGFSLTGKGKEKDKASAGDAHGEHDGPAEWEWLDEFGTIVAREDWAALGEHYVPRLVTTAAMRRELFDVLVSSWCLRLWWQNADRVAHHEGAFTGCKSLCNRFFCSFFSLHECGSGVCSKDNNVLTYLTIGGGIVRRKMKLVPGGGFAPRAIWGAGIGAST